MFQKKRVLVYVGFMNMCWANPQFGADLAMIAPRVFRNEFLREPLPTAVISTNVGNNLAVNMVRSELTARKRLSVHARSSQRACLVSCALDRSTNRLVDYADKVRRPGHLFIFEDRQSSVLKGRHKRVFSARDTSSLLWKGLIK